MPRLARAALTTALLTLVAIPAAAPAFADTEHARQFYVALGDSLAVGVQPDPTTGEDQLTDRGYVDRIHAALRAANRKVDLANFGCGGETTVTMIAGGRCDYGHFDSQLDAASHFLRAHKHVTLVTIDIGANDVARCVRGTTVDQACIAGAFATAQANLSHIVATLRTAGGPKLRIVAMNYYNPFLAGWLAGPAGQALATQSVGLTVAFNNLEEAVYGAAGIGVADVEAAFSTTDFVTSVPLPGAGLVPLNVARICQWTWMCAPAPIGPNIHANDAGYQVIAEAFLAAI